MSSTKLIDSELIVRATAELSQSVMEDLKKEDPANNIVVAILAGDNDEEDKDS